MENVIENQTKEKRTGNGTWDHMAIYSNYLG